MKFFITLQFASYLCLVAGYWGPYWGPYYSPQRYSAPYTGLYYSPQGYSPYTGPSVSPWSPYSSSVVASNPAPVASSCPTCVTPQYEVCGLNSYKDDFQTFPSLCYMQLNNCYNVSNVYQMQHYGQCRTPATACSCPKPVQCPAPTVCLPCPACPLLPTAPLPTASTAAGYQFVAGLGNYKFHSTSASWPVAYATCLSEGAYLVVFNSEVENAAVLKIYKANLASVTGAGSIWAWVGYQESAAKSNDYFSILGDKMSCSGFKRWHAGEPNANTLGDNTCMHSGDGGLGDIPLTDPTPLPYICERHS